MAVDNIDSIQSGVLEEDSSVVVSAVASSANIIMFGVVVQTAKGTGEDLPRVGMTTTANDVAYGIAVNPLAAAGIAAVSIGDTLEVCIWGLCKLKVNGNSDNIELNDGLVTSTTAGIAVLAAIDVGGTPDQASINAAIQQLANIFAKACEASAADNDFIPVRVYGSKGTIT
jgi:hypothetical protein